MRAISTDASVWPARTSVPPSRASSGNTWPGVVMSSRRAVRVDRHGDRLGAVGGGNAGRDALARFDRDGERGLVARAVLLAHERQAKLFDPCPGQRQADQAARMACHEVDRVGCRELRRDNQIAFVFAVLVIDQDEHPAVAGFLDQFLGGGQVLRKVGGNEFFLQVFHHAVSARRAT